MVPLAGPEPARCFHHRILSQARLPIPPQGLGLRAEPGAGAADHNRARRRVNLSLRMRGTTRREGLRLGRPLFPWRPSMSEEALNMSLRKFLKVVGVTSQQEIEKARRAAVADGRLKGIKSVDAQMVLTIGKVNLNHKVAGVIEIE